MRYNAVPSIGRNNPVLKTRWDETVTCMQRKLLDLQHDESIRIVNDTRKKAEQDGQALKDASASDAEHTEAKLAIRLCTDKVCKSDKAERLARLTRDMDKRRTRAERSPAPAEKRENSRGKRQQKKNFQNPACMYINHWQAYPHNNLSPVQARITTFGLEVHNILVKIPIVFFPPSWFSHLFHLSDLAWIPRTSVVH